MEIKIVKNTKEVLCDVLVVNKFEGKETSNALVNRFAPESFQGKAGQMFVIHTQKEYPADQILAIGLGQENHMDNNVVRENESLMSTIRAFQMQSSDDGNGNEIVAELIKRENEASERTNELESKQNEIIELKKDLSSLITKLRSL